MKTIRLGIVNRNRVYLDSLEQVLNAHWQFQVIFTSRGYLDFLECLADAEPDIILMDAKILKELTHQDSSGFLRYVKDIPIAILGFKIPALMHRYSRSHAALEFLSKEHDGETLVERLLEIVDTHLDMSSMGIH